MKKILKDKKVAGFFCIYFYLFLSVLTDLTYFKRTEFIIQLVLIFGCSLVLILSMYLCRNIIFRFVVFAAVCVVICFVNYKFLPFIACPYTLMYIYKASIVEKNANNTLNVIYFLFSLSLSIMGIVKDIQIYKETPEEYNRPELFCIGTFFIILFILIIKVIRNDTKLTIKKDSKTLYTMIFVGAIFGVLCAVLSGNILLTSSFRYNPLYSGNLPLAPWYFFLLVFLYERDEVIYFFSFKVMENILQFLDPTKKLSKFKYYQK